MSDINQLSAVSQTFALPLPLEFPIKHSVIKRTFDILFSLSCVVLTAPIMLFIALAVRLFSKGQVVYAHERIGRGGKPFKCYKFRTMYPDADERLKMLLEQHPSLREEWEASHKLKNDPRVTPIGKFLRSTSLDEFPQFINVLKGDLSVVGPRPVVRAEINKHIRHKATKILSVRPGITGLWQVSGRSDTSYEKRIALDERYVDEVSLLMDVKIILKTLPAMVSSKGAY